MSYRQRPARRVGRLLLFAGVIGLLVACAGHPLAKETSPTSEAATAIAAARARSNAAIARHDVAAIAREWTPDANFVSSIGNVTTGADINAQFMQEAFARRPDTKRVRTPSRIDVFDAWQVASEEGHWVGTWTDPDGAVRISGTYLAQWRRIDGRWLIRAELFVPVGCEGGAYCAAHP